MTKSTSLAVFGAFADNIDVRLAMRTALTVPELLNTTVDLVFLTRAAVSNEGGRMDNASDFADWLQITGAGAFWRPASYRAQLGLPPVPSPRVDGRRRRLDGPQPAQQQPERGLQRALQGRHRHLVCASTRAVKHHRTVGAVQPQLDNGVGTTATHSNHVCTRARASSSRSWSA